MRDITRDEIRRAFGEKTFARGLEYFENGYVEKIISTIIEEEHRSDFKED